MTRSDLRSRPVCSRMSALSNRRAGPAAVACRTMFMVLGVILSIAVLHSRLQAQTGIPFNQRDDTYPLLGLKRAREAFEFARADMERQEAMYGKGLISFQELERAKNSFADAEVNYQQSLLAVLFERQFVSVVNAVKYQAQDGHKHVRVTLANTSGGGADFRKLIEMDDELFRSLQPDVINDVYVSLLNGENAIISRPYEAKVERLLYGKPVELDFALLQDLDALTVDIVYGNGSQRSPKIFLQKDSSVNMATIYSEQFSQEVELGGSAVYDLHLELFSSATNTFKLEVVNLPPQITRYFADPASEARLSQLRFTERTNSMKAAMKIFLPDRPTGEVTVGEPISFFVVAVPQDRMVSIEGLSSRKWTIEEIEALNVGYARLEIVPRGNGRLLVKAPQLYHSIEKGGIVEMDIDVINDGTRRLDNVEFEIDTPPGWQKTTDPLMIQSLDIRKESRIRIVLTPPGDVTAGRYEFRVRTSSLSGDLPIRGEEKTVTVEVKAGANVLGTLSLVILIVGIISAIVVFGIRLSRQ